MGRLTSGWNDGPNFLWPRIVEQHKLVEFEGDAELTCWQNRTTHWSIIYSILDTSKTVETTPMTSCLWLGSGTYLYSGEFQNPSSFILLLCPSSGLLVIFKLTLSQDHLLTLALAQSHENILVRSGLLFLKTPVTLFGFRFIQERWINGVRDLWPIGWLMMTTMA